MTLALLEDELKYLEENKLYRVLKKLKPSRGMHARWNEKDVLLFCGNDYLGLSRHPRMIQAVKQAADIYGVGSGAARLISGTSDLHTRLEEKVAEFKKKPKALVYSTGYLANIGILTALAGENDLIVMDKLCHASLIDGARLSGAKIRVFPHRHYERCEEILSAATSYGKWILVTETVFSMDGDLADLQELIRIKQRYDAILLVDDAHGTGVMGRTGRGACEDLGIENEIDILMGTLSKAVGAMGGFAAANSTYIEYLINRSRPFIFSTSLSPVLCAASLEAIRIIEEEPSWHQRLWRRVEQLKNILEGSGFEIGTTQSPIFPIMMGSQEDALRAAESFMQQGIFIPAIRPPTVPKGKSRLRMTVSAVHEDEDFTRLEEAIEAGQFGLKKKVG